MSETEKMVAPADFSGPSGNRGCTDILCLLMLLGHWVAMTGLGIFAIQEGDYRLITYPSDYYGNICGLDYNGVNMEAYPYLLPVNGYGTGVCISKCPKLTNLADPFTVISVTGIYQTDGAQSPLDFELPAVYSTEIADTAAEQKFCSNDDLDCFDYTEDFINEGSGFGFYAVDTEAYLSRCLMSTAAITKLAETVTDVAALDESTEDAGFISELYADVYTARSYIFGFGFCVSVVIGFSYAFLLRLPGVLFVMVWGSIGMIFAMFMGMGGYAFSSYTEWDTEDPKLHTDSEISGLMYFSYVFFALGALWVCLMCFLRSRIQLALGIVKEASKAVAHMPALIFYPIIQVLGLAAFMGIWCVYSLYLASLGDFGTSSITYNEVEIVYRDFEYSDDQEWAAWYLLFCYFWTSQFIIALGQIVSAMAIAKYYFSRDKDTIHNNTVWASMKDATWYHSGTAAFGSLIIAIIKMIRAFIAYAQKKAEKSGNKAAKAVLCALQCYMWCMEKCMKFLNKNAYIQTAIFGTSFCTSAKNAFFLILRNIARIAAVTIVSEFVILIGKTFIAIMTGGLAYYLMNENIGDELYSSMGPVFFVMILAWFTGCMFMEVFSMAISTILQCFIADEEMFEGSERYADGALKEWVDNHGAHKDEVEENQA